MDCGRAGTCRYTAYSIPSKKPREPVTLSAEDDADDFGVREAIVATRMQVYERIIDKTLAPSPFAVKRQFVLATTRLNAVHKLSWRSCRPTTILLLIPLPTI